MFFVNTIVRAMSYREKTCPKCGTKHNKRGEYCSRSCGNSRPMPKHQRESMSESKKKWHAESDVAAVVAHNYVSKRINGDPEPIAPVRSERILDQNQFVEDGDLWTFDRDF